MITDEAEKRQPEGAGRPSKKTSMGMRTPFFWRMKFPAWTSCMRMPDGACSKTRWLWREPAGRQPCEARSAISSACVGCVPSMVFCRPFQKTGLLGVDLCRAGTERVFRYPCLRELAKRLFCWNCDLASSSDKLCGRGLRWPKSGAWGAGFVLHFSGCGLMTFIEEMWCI